MSVFHQINLCFPRFLYTEYEVKFVGVGFDDTQSKVFHEIDYHCAFCKEYFINIDDKNGHQMYCIEKMI